LDVQPSFCILCKATSYRLSSDDSALDVKAMLKRIRIVGTNIFIGILEPI
jgi:hypothetical protein